MAYAVRISPHAVRICNCPSVIVQKNTNKHQEGKPTNIFRLFCFMARYLICLLYVCSMWDVALVLIWKNDGWTYCTMVPWSQRLKPTGTKLYLPGKSSKGRVFCRPLDYILSALVWSTFDWIFEKQQERRKTGKTEQEQAQACEESNQRKGKAKKSKQTTKQQKEWNKAPSFSKFLYILYSICIGPARGLWNHLKI